MNPIHTYGPACVLALASACTLAAHAQDTTEAPAPVGDIEAYASAQSLNNGYGDWHEVGLRGHLNMGNQVLGLEAASMKRFGESGVYVGLSDTVTLDQDWFTTLSIGAGDGAAYLPRYRIDAFLNRKLLPGRQLVATLGAGYYRAPDDHTDRNVSLGATYYFESPWVVQGEIRFNNSSPGQVKTHQQFLAATWGRVQQTQVTVRHGWGAEGYQAIGSGASLVNFDSQQSQLSVRHWLGPKWGITAALERYSNPFYVRKGATVALFWELP